MTITYLKKADKTPQTGTDELRPLCVTCWPGLRLRARGKRSAPMLDGFTGDVIVSKDQIAAAADKVSDQLKADIQFSYDRVTKFAQAQNNPSLNLKQNYHLASGRARS